MIFTHSLIKLDKIYHSYSTESITVTLYFLYTRLYNVWSKSNHYFKFFPKVFTYLSINILSPSKWHPAITIHLCQAFFPILETLLKGAFCYRSCFCFFLPLQSLQNAFLSSVSLVLGRGKSQRGPNPAIMVVEAWLHFCFWPKTQGTSIDVWAGALSWPKIHDWFFHNSVRFWRIALRNLRITSR